MKCRYETSQAQSVVVTDGPATNVDFHLEPTHKPALETSTKNTWHATEASADDTHSTARVKTLVSVTTENTRTNASVQELVHVTDGDTRTTVSIEESTITTTSLSVEDTHATDAAKVPLQNTLSPGEFETL